jgi:hypothetical protein
MDPGIRANIVLCARERAFIAAAADDRARYWRELAAVRRLLGLSCDAYDFDQLAGLSCDAYDFDQLAVEASR